jgi:T3SS (YopN, CesT) and YbjN peptide-binding chaperone 1
VTADDQATAPEGTGTAAPPPPQPPASGTPAPPAPPASAEPDVQLLLVKDKVDRYLRDLGVMTQNAHDGSFTFQSGSARVFVRCLRWGKNSTLVNVYAPVLYEVTPSPELYEHIATHADDYVFGHLSAAPQTEGTVTVMFTHTLLGDFLDPDELKQAVVGVVATSDGIDDELKAKFGGHRFHDDVTT